MGSNGQINNKVIPKLDTEFYLIIGQDSKELSAICLSYVSKLGIYTPIFEFPSVSCKKEDFTEKEFNQNSISHSRATEFNIRVHNNLKRLKGTEYLLLIGLTDEQMSYLDFSSSYNTLEITTCDDAEFYLSSLTLKTDYYPLDKSQIEQSLFNAIRLNKILSDKVSVIENEENETNCNNGIVVVEGVNYANTIIAVNFANSINADLELLDKPDFDKQEVKLRLHEFKQEGIKNSFDELTSKIYPLIEHINLSDKKWVTYFTIGIPYSLVTGNTIPTSYVNLNLSPDFFVFNNIYYENQSTLNSSIVFSPLEFGSDEETLHVIKELKERGHFVMPLIGKDANVYNLDMHIKQYPFGILHICSHGGEVDGYSITEKFKDSKGDEHTIEYDEVVSFAPNPYDKLIPVTSKYIWRKFDGYNWRSDELKSIGYDHHVFSDMFNAVKKNVKKNRVKKNNIPNSCSIKCSDFVYQGMFNHLAGDHFSPFIFNNTCWSWSGISDSFLSEGCRGYIGTLWNIDNSVARKTAEDFYVKTTTSTIIDSLFNSLEYSNGTKDENIYIFWGLPFSTVSNGVSEVKSLSKVLFKLSYSIGQWKEHLKNHKQSLSQETQDEIERLITWCQNTIKKIYP